MVDTGNYLPFEFHFCFRSDGRKDIVLVKLGDPFKLVCTILLPLDAAVLIDLLFRLWFKLYTVIPEIRFMVVDLVIANLFGYSLRKCFATIGIELPGFI